MPTAGQAGKYMVGIFRSYPIQLGQLHQRTFSVKVVGVCGTFMSMNTGVGDGVGGVLLKNIMNKETSTPPGICCGVLRDTTLGNGLRTKSATIIIYILKTAARPTRQTIRKRGGRTRKINCGS